MWPHRAIQFHLGFELKAILENVVKSFSGKPKTSQGAVRSTVLLPGSTANKAEPSPTRSWGAEKPGQDQAQGSNRHQTQVSGHQANLYSRTGPRASEEADLEGLHQGQNHSSSSQGTGITAAQQQCSTAGPGVKSQLKTAPRGQEDRPVLLCFFTTALISGGWLTLDTASYAPEGDLSRVWQGGSIFPSLFRNIIFSTFSYSL